MPEERKSWVDDPAQLEATINRLRQEHAAARSLDKTLLRLYYQRPVTSTADPMRPYAEISTFETLQQLGFGLTREVIDADVAQICRPLQAKVAPQAADFQVQRSCEHLSRLVDGIMDVTEFLQVATRAYKDGELVTAGWVKWFVDAVTAEIKCERVNPLNVDWHYEEGDDPAHLYTVEPVPRHALKARYPEYAAKIEALPAYKVPSLVGVTPPGIRGGDCVRVNEGWRVKLGDKPGTKSVTSGPVVFEHERWPYDFHQLVPCTWDSDHEGIGGVSLARVLAPYHVWSNMLVRQVYESFMAAVPWLLSYEDSLVDEVSDLPMQLVKWSGDRKPEVYVPNPVSPQVLQQIQAIRERAFAAAGANPQAAAGSWPRALSSAPAQREWIDIVSVRATQRQRTWERLWRKSARIIVGLAAKTYADKTLRVKAPGTDLIEEITFPKDLKEDQYR